MACDTVTLMLNSDSAVTGVRSVIQCFDTSGFYEAVRTWYWNQFDREYLPTLSYFFPLQVSPLRLVFGSESRYLSLHNELTLKSYRTSFHINTDNHHHTNENHRLPDHRDATNHRHSECSIHPYQLWWWLERGMVRMPGSVARYAICGEPYFYDRMAR